MNPKEAMEHESSEQNIRFPLIACGFRMRYNNMDGKRMQNRMVNIRATAQHTPCIKASCIIVCHRTLDEIL